MFHTTFGRVCIELLPGLYAHGAVCVLTFVILTVLILGPDIR